MTQRNDITIVVLFGVLACCAFHSFGQTSLQTAKPWTYWWWMGSAVDEENIAKELTQFSESGLGGVHIIPIYGVKGYEEQFIPFLSERWMEVVQFTIEKAGELGLGVDITLGTGWPYGGQWIDNRLSAKQFQIIRHFVEDQDDYSIEELKNRYELDSLFGLFVKDDTTNLLNSFIEQRVKNHIGDTVLILGARPTMQQVKRAAPGGKGLVMDYFDELAVQTYLDYFDSVFAATNHPISPRAFYHDSYEVFGANSTPEFFEAFRDIHHYDLKNYLHVFTDTSHVLYPYIIYDVRVVFDELLFSNFATIWTQYSNDHNKLSRYQAHGSPANILDLYGLSDIPETESFGCSSFDIPGLNCDRDYEEKTFGRPNPLVMKLASSPAHLLGKPMVSAETGTWLANHFKVSLRSVKPQIDELFTAGVNHVFYHGTTYSPENEGFPGWLFYASTNFGKTSHFKDELPLLNSYIEKSQVLFQNAKPDNNILLYFPLADIWTKHKGGTLLALDVHHYANWFSATTFGETAELLWDNGYSFDYISDRQLSMLNTDDALNVFVTEGAKYQTIVVPEIDYIPEQTLAKLGQLAARGVEVIFSKHFPSQYAGLNAYQSYADVDIGDQIIMTDDLLDLLKQNNVPQEELSNKGLDFIRKKNDSGHLYFIVNFGSSIIADTFRLASDYETVTITNAVTGVVEHIETNDKFYFSILPGESYFLQTGLRQSFASKSRIYQIDTLSLEEQWTVIFTDYEQFGIKKQYSIDKLTPYTTWGDQALNSYVGKAKYMYQLKLNEPNENIPEKYVLAFDQINESAEVIINGISYGTIWSFPNQIELPASALEKDNRIEIIVQNLSANYMRVYDEQYPEWKKFYDINFVDITYTPFQASKWEITPSGLGGDVELITYR
ncbi:MAG: glycoside hydrolase [Cyclobacteriaceae bacterium]